MILLTNCHCLARSQGYTKERGDVTSQCMLASSAGLESSSEDSSEGREEEEDSASEDVPFGSSVRSPLLQDYGEIKVSGGEELLLMCKVCVHMDTTPVMC